MQHAPRPMFHPPGTPAAEPPLDAAAAMRRLVMCGAQAVAAAAQAPLQATAAPTLQPPLQQAGFGYQPAQGSFASSAFAAPPAPQPLPGAWSTNGSRDGASTGTAQPQAFTKASSAAQAPSPSPAQPQPATASGTSGAAGPRGVHEDLAAALRNHLHNPTDAPSIELFQALAKAAQLPGASSELADAAGAGAPAVGGAEEAKASQGHTADTTRPAAMVASARSTSGEDAPQELQPAGSVAAGGTAPSLTELGTSDAPAPSGQHVNGARSTPGLVPAQGGPEVGGGRETQPPQEQGGSVASVPNSSVDRPLPSALPLVARATAGPAEAVYRYDLGSSDDLDAYMRNIRRRIEVELEDGCTVQVCLQMAR
mmetsp:Transcript_15431/g.44183  ORF Transcript_15431/g.44183 Transcript_15431/m.44183 type:complete len:368 (+) Transcript_15431:50-1153(+)